MPTSQVLPNPSLHLTRYSRLRRPPHAGELKRSASQATLGGTHNRPERQHAVNCRSTLRVFSGLLALWPAALLGQSPKRLPIIGVPLVYARDNDEIMVALRRGLRDRGYVDGENIRIEHRFAYGRMERVPALVQELVRLKADVFVAGAEPIARILQEASSTTPIVLVAMWGSILLPLA